MPAAVAFPSRRLLEDVPELEQRPTLPLPECLAAQARFAGKVRERRAVPEEAADEPAVGLTEALQGAGHLVAQGGVGAGAGLGVLLHHVLGQRPAAEAPFLAVAGPDPVDDAA